MNDDLSGGGTVFPRLGLSAFPRSGSALFWLNLSGDGDVEYQSLHSGCPPVRGVKWGEEGKM